jgi:hypothetical protein
MRERPGSLGVPPFRAGTAFDRTRPTRTVESGSNAQQTFVKSFVAAWTKVMDLDRYDLLVSKDLVDQSTDIALR